MSHTCLGDFWGWIGADVPSWLMALVVAHRGASALHPPGNTLEAFGAATSLGADWVELDVHALSDGSLVVHHDPTLPDGRALDDLRLQDLPGWVPTLADSINSCGPLGVNVEIKGDGSLHLRPALIADTLALLRSIDDPDRFLVTSFDWKIIEEVRELAPELRTGFLTMDPRLTDELLDRVAAAGHVAINPWDAIVRLSVVNAAHARGLAVNVWTVDEPERISELLAMGVDAIITNVPDRCRELLSAG